jgi:hypothetical protein
VDHILEMPGLVGHRSRRLEVARRTDQVEEPRTAPEEVELHIALAVEAHRTVLAAVVRRIDPGEEARHTGPGEAGHHIDLEAGHHIDLKEAHHTALEAVELHIDPGVEAHRTVLAVEVRRTVPEVAVHSLAGAGSRLEEDIAVDSALEAVVDSNLAEGVVRILGVGELSGFSICSP